MASKAQGVRGGMTFLGVAASGFLIWLSTHFDSPSTSDYWIRVGLLAGAGLVLPLSQLFGGWTKGGWPRFSHHVLLTAFLPALIVAGWVILSAQPDSNWFQHHVTDWSGDLHVARLVRHLREGYVLVLAFGLGVVFGFSFDTTGPKVVPAASEPEPAPTETLPPAAPDETAVTRVEEPAAEPEAAETEVVQPAPSAETDETRVTPTGDDAPQH